MDQKENKNKIKKFLIKLIAITFAIIIIINSTYNMIFADKLEKLNKIFSLNEKENIDLVKDKIRLEISKGLEKEKIFSDKDKKLLLELYKKLKKEFEDIETN
jgi:cell division protein YceG involved in septum cleavage|tara:strand:- start:385 stop:690 length:306 start_codon:yes stop_codon:yes gene_type:complete